MDQDPFYWIRRNANSPRASKPAVIAALEELGVTGRMAASRAGISITACSFWKNGHTPIPEKHLPALRNLVHEASQAILSIRPNDSFRMTLNQIRVKRAQDFLDAESKDLS